MICLLEESNGGVYALFPKILFLSVSAVYTVALVQKFSVFSNLDLVCSSSLAHYLCFGLVGLQC